MTDTHGWRDIATAPKDGTKILAGCLQSDTFKYFLTWWNKRWDIWVGEGDERYGIDFKPTHWQPLPPPPEGV